MEETIVALATSSGKGAISIVRLSGINAYKLALKHTKKNELTPRYVTLSNIYDNDSNIIDEAIVIYFNSPKSYTGEDIIEFQTHGGSSVASLLIDELLKSGARVANAGEFTKRAVLNGKIDLAKAEAIKALISSNSKASVKLLARQLKGDLGIFVDNIRDDLIEIIAHTEVSIDYAEDDIPDNILRGINSKITNIKNLLINTLETSKKRDSILTGYRVGIIGKPNTGKSSLLNRLLSYERAIVSDIEGTTRDSVEAELYVGDFLIKIIDTAGIRNSIEEIEKIGIQRSREIAKEVDLLIGMFDGSSIFDSNDQEIVNILSKSRDTEVIAVINKKDLPNRLLTKELDNFSIINISTKQSIDPVLDRIKETLERNDSTQEQVLVSKRQRDIVEKTIEELNMATSLVNEGSLELFSYHIQSSIENITQITKPYSYSDVLDVMFGDFCLGK